MIVTNVQHIKANKNLALFNCIPATLVLLVPDTDYVKVSGMVGTPLLKPVLVSDQRIVEGDMYLQGSELLIADSNTHIPAITETRKVVATSKEFSNEDLKKIVEGELVGGEVYWLECEGYVRSSTWEHDEPEWWEIKHSVLNKVYIYKVTNIMWKQDEVYTLATQLYTCMKAKFLEGKPMTARDLEDWWLKHKKK